MHAVQRRGRAAAAWDYAPVAVELVIDVATNINDTGGHAGRVLTLCGKCKGARQRGASQGKKDERWLTAEGNMLGCKKRWTAGTVIGGRSMNPLLAQKTS